MTVSAEIIVASAAVALTALGLFGAALAALVKFLIGMESRLTQAIEGRCQLRFDHYINAAAVTTKSPVDTTVKTVQMADCPELWGQIDALIAPFLVGEGGPYAGGTIEITPAE